MATTSTSKALAPKAKRFAEEYVVDLNATQAAIRAGYSAKSAYSQAHDLLRKPEVAEAISEAMRRRSEATGITASRVLQEIALIAFSDITDIVDNHTGELLIKRLSDLPRPVRRLIESVKETPGEFGIARAVKLHPKIPALKLLVDHLGLEAPKKLEHGGKDGGPIETATIRYVVKVPKEEEAEEEPEAGP